MKRKIFKYPFAVLLAGAVLLAAAVPVGAAEDNLPESYSSVEKGYVTEVKTQHGLDCWAYASTATMESALLSAGVETDNMSPDHLNLWSVTRSNGKGWIRGLSSSGYGSCALGYLASWQGGVFTSDLEDYTLSDYIYGDEAPEGLVRYGVTSARFLTKDDLTDVKRQIFRHGGIYTSLAWNQSMCMAKDSVSYYMPENFTGSYQGHAVELVGWDDNYPAEKFMTNLTGEKPQNNGAFLVKNSHGRSNPLGGYIWISYEDKYLLHSRYAPSFSIESFEEVNDSKKLLQNEIYGATYEFDYVAENNLIYMNHFDFTDDFFKIDKVIFKTEAQGSEYIIYFVPDENGVPANDKSEWTAISSGTVDFKGYICDDINDFEVPYKSGSIAIEINSTATGKTATLGVDEWLVDGSGDYVFINESVKGQSYLAHDGVIEDVLDWYKSNNNDDLGGTFIIKAIALKSNDYIKGDVNLDGIFNIKDATEIQRYIAHLHNLEGRALRAADFNGDGIINITDATAVQRVLARQN